MQSAISGHNPSVGIGLFNHNLPVNYGSHQMANPQAFNNIQLPAQCSVSNSPAQMWQHFASASGGFLPTTYSAMEPTSRLAASSSMSVPYGNSLDIASSSKAESYPYMANYISQMGSRLFYNANTAPTAPYGALSYADLFPQAASFSGARNLAATWHGMNRLDLNTLPASLHDSVPASQVDSYSISNNKPGMITSLMNTVPFSSDNPTKSNHHDIVGIYQRDTNNTQTASNDIKTELVYSVHNSGNLPNYQQVLSNAQSRSSPFGNDLQQSPADQDHKQHTMDANYLPALSSRDCDTEVSGSHSSRRSSAFMIDMLLKPQQSMWSREGKSGASASGHHNAPPQSLSSFQGYKSTGESKEPLYYNHNEFKVRIMNRMKAESDYIRSLNFDVGNTSCNPNVTHGDNGSFRNATSTFSNSVKNGESQLRCSTPNHSDSESSLGDTLEDIDVYNTDEDIIANELKSRCDHATEAFYQGTAKSDSVEDASKDEHEELTRNKCCYDSEFIKTKEMASQGNSSFRFNQSDGVSCGDSGLGRSSYAPSSGLHQTRPGSVEGVKTTEIEPGKVQYMNKENARVTPTPLKKKRRLSVSEVSNNVISKKGKFHNHSFTATSDFRNCLRDISENYGENCKNQENRDVSENYVENGNTQENSPQKLQIHLASNSGSSSEDETTTRESTGVLHPQYTSTPIGHAKIKKSRFFLEAICQFAKYCQIEATDPPEKDNCASVTHTPSKSSPLKRPLSPARAGEDSYGQLSRSESQSSKLERLDRFQRILMRKVRNSDTYTMAEFKADALKLNSLAQDAGGCRHLKF